MLEIYIKHFLESFIVYYIRNYQKAKELVKVSNDFINSKEFGNDFFGWIY